MLKRSVAPAQGARHLFQMTYMVFEDQVNSLRKIIYQACIREKFFIFGVHIFES